ncbi:MAG: hypothetical protein ACOCUS_05025, partial [Polyangiales bacterium]
MLLSRFWLFLLTVAAGTALAAALLAQSTYNRQSDSHLADQLRRDRVEMELWLRLDARARLDAIAPIAAHGDVRSGLSETSGKDEVDEDTANELEQTLGDLNDQLEGMKGALLFAVDDTGRIVVQLGGKNKPPEGAGLGEFPLVKKALSGYVRDDIWVYNEGVYRMAARPVIDSGKYVGAIVHGMKMDEELAQKLAKRLPGATVAFFMREDVMAAHMPSVENAATSEEVATPLAKVLGGEKLEKDGRTDAIDLGRSSRGMYAEMTGAAAHAGVGYAIARPRTPLGSPWAIFEQASSEDVQALPWPILGGGALGLFLLGMLWFWLERDRPFGKFRTASEALASREVDRLQVTDFGGKYRKIAENVNAALDKATEGAATASKRRPADLDEILGPTPGEKKQDYFGFAADEGDDDVPDVPGAPGGGPPPGGPPAGGPPPGGPPAGG